MADRVIKVGVVLDTTGFEKSIAKFNALVADMPRTYVVKPGGRVFVAKPSAMAARSWWRKLFALPPRG